MPIKDVFKVSRKTFFNPRAWLGYDLLKAQTRETTSLIKDVVHPDESPHYQETFEEAMERFHLTEADIQKTQKNYLIIALVFLALAIPACFFALYLFFQGKFLGGLLALSLASLLLANAFRYHFWFFEIKQRKLGCTLNEWSRGVFRGIKKNKSGTP